MTRYTVPKTCSKKIAYPSKKAASKSLVNIPGNRNKLRDSLGPYECNICGKWHLGHKYRMGMKDSLQQTFEKLKHEK